jgi:hypothetical protein
MPEPGSDPFSRSADESERSGYARIHSTRPPQQARRNVWPWVTAGVLASFVIGLLGSPWLEGHVRSRLPAAVQPPVSSVKTPEVQALEARLAKLETRPVAPVVAQPSSIDAPVADRLAALEAAAAARQTSESELAAQIQVLSTDLARLGDQALSRDDRIRDLFLLTVVRRMVESGRPLTAIEENVAARFRARDGAAVDALAAWSREPQTRRTLAARLPDLGRAGAEADAAAAGGWWARLKAGLSSLVTVRDPAGEGTPDRVEAVEAAAAALRDDDLELAVSELASGPQSAATRQWERDARLLLAAEVALDRLDGLALTAAIPAAEPDPAPAAQAPVNAAPVNAGPVNAR